MEGVDVGSEQPRLCPTSQRETIPPSSPSLRPGLSSWQIPPRSLLTPFSLPLHLHPFVFPSSKIVFTLARLVIVAGPTSFILPAYHFTSFFHSLLSLPIRGPTCHCGRSRLVFPFYLPSLSLSLSLSLFPLLSLSCRPARAGRHGRSKVILLPLCHERSTSDLTGFHALREVPVAPDCLAVPHLPVPCHYDGLRRLAVPRFYILCGRYGSLQRPCRVLPAAQEHLSGF